MRKLFFCKELKIYENSTCSWAFNAGNPDELLTQMKDHFKFATIHENDRDPSINLSDLESYGAKDFFNNEQMFKLDTK